MWKKQIFKPENIIIKKVAKYKIWKSLMFNVDQLFRYYISFSTIKTTPIKQCKFNEDKEKICVAERIKLLQKVTTSASPFSIFLCA